ncbi:MAG: hypothetical protein KDK27_04615 [Leptospiraceae bacterium]|nr:hypothetical protein [Leptospiraceae bacterium]
MSIEDLEKRLHTLELTVGSLEWLMWVMRGALTCMMPERARLPFMMIRTEDGFEYPVPPQLPISERNALIMVWHGEGKTIREIQGLLYGRGHCTKQGDVIRGDTVQRVIDSTLAKGGEDAA